MSFLVTIFSDYNVEKHIPNSLSKESKTEPWFSPPSVPCVLCLSDRYLLLHPTLAPEDGTGNYRSVPFSRDHNLYWDLVTTLPIHLATRLREVSQSLQVDSI